jgi:hypothetical protein
MQALRKIVKTLTLCKKNAGAMRMTGLAKVVDPQCGVRSHTGYWLTNDRRSIAVIANFKGISQKQSYESTRVPRSISGPLSIAEFC